MLTESVPYVAFGGPSSRQKVRPLSAIQRCPPDAPGIHIGLGSVSCVTPSAGVTAYSTPSAACVGTDPVTAEPIRAITAAHRARRMRNVVMLAALTEPEPR